jgi:autotransporter-associated beta strand protein
MLRQGFSILALALTMCAGAANAQTIVIWGGGFPDDRSSAPSNWSGGVGPLGDGTEILQFTDQSDMTLRLGRHASFYGISLQSNEGYGGVFADLTGHHALTLGAGGITMSGSGDFLMAVTFDVPVILADDQTWDAMEVSYGVIMANRAISGDHSLSLSGNGNYETFQLNSGDSTFSGGATLTGENSTLVLGASSSGSPGSPTSGPVGTGRLTLGDGTTLTASAGNTVTLANPLTLGDASTGNAITLGGAPAMRGANGTSLTFTGPVTLVGYVDPELQLVIAPDSMVTFCGDLTASSPGLQLNLSGEGVGTSLAIAQGGFINVSGIGLDQDVSLILDGSGISQVSGVGSISTRRHTYLGLGSGYSAAGGVTSFIGYLNSIGADSAFQGTLGFDTTSGETATFDDPVDLTLFTACGFTGLGSATSAILGAGAVITPPAESNTYRFGGGGGTLKVKSPLADLSDGSNTALSLNGGNGPLTLVLSGALTYGGSTSVTNAALIFDTPPPAGSISVNWGYAGATPNAGFTDGLGNIQSFVDMFCAANGVIGFDSLSGTQQVTSPIVMPSCAYNLFLGTATSVNYSGDITPAVTNQYMFSGVKGGQVTVSSNLVDFNSETARSVAVGLTSPIESTDRSTGLPTISSVTLSGDNSYSGGTYLQSGYLYVTNSNSLGSGDLIVSVGAGNNWSGTLAVSPGAGGPVWLANNIQIGGNGLALNAGAKNLLTLSGTISDHSDTYGSLGIFGPVDIEGEAANTYSGGTTIDSGGATVTLGKDLPFGFGWVSATNSTLEFTSANPQIDGLSLSNGVTATFAGSPVIGMLEMAESTLNFNGPAAEIDGLYADPSHSHNSINLGDGTDLTINGESDYEGGMPTFHGTISGASGSLFVTGGNGLNLAGSNSYGGGTTIDDGAFLIASNNSALGTGPVVVSPGAALVTNKGITLANPITLGDGGGLAGYGTFAPGGAITIANASIIDPGSAGFNNRGLVPPTPGTITFGNETSLTFGSGGIYWFSVSDANGAPGSGYSTVDLAGGTLGLASSADHPFRIDVLSFDPATNLQGLALNFSSSGAYSWTLVSAGSISGAFDPGLFNIDTAGFSNSTGAGHFFVSETGGDLMLNFTPVPEPSTWALMATGLCALGAAIIRRRR